jgi:transcriptional regulator with XRE-family HTH domain
MNFSKNLNAYMAKNNMSLKELALKLGVPNSTVHGWLNGIPPKNILMMKKISTHLNCSIDQLCFDQEPLKTENFQGLIESNLILSLGDDSFQLILKKVIK